MSIDGKASPRDRLLAAAASLTYREGVGVGIEALCKAAGVSKRSMYQLFTSKDELLAASLEAAAAAYIAAFLPSTDDQRSARERILHVFDRLETASAAPDFHGCQYLAAQVELKDPAHPARQVANGVKQQLTGFFRAEAARGGAVDPDRLARQLAILFDGASARAGVRADDLDGLLASTASTLLDAADVR